MQWEAWVANNEEFNLDRLDVWGAEQQFTVDADRTIAYAKATNDPIVEHLNGTLTPPVFAVVPAMVAMTDATLSVVPDELMLKILHGEHDLHIFRPIDPGEALTVRAKPIGITGKFSGTVVTTLVETRSNRGDLVNKQYFVGFFRGGKFEGSVGVAPPDHAFDETLRERDPSFTAVQRFDEDQTFRYSEAAGDPMPIHLDEDFAKAMGLPGIIIHGLCTIAFTSHALITAISPDDPSRLTRLAVRLTKPGLPNETITSRVWRTGDGVYAYDTLGETPGKFLITDGLAEFKG